MDGWMDGWMGISKPGSRNCWVKFNKLITNDAFLLGLIFLWLVNDKLLCFLLGWDWKIGAFVTPEAGLDDITAWKKSVNNGNFYVIWFLKIIGSNKILDSWLDIIFRIRMSSEFFVPSAIFMSPVSLVFHTEATVSIGLKNVLRLGTSIL